MESRDNLAEVVITATHEEYSSFIASAVWQDMKRELETQRAMILEHLGTTDTPMELYRLQGQLTACDDFISMPADFTAMLEHRFAEQETVDSEFEPATASDHYDAMLQHYKEPDDGNGL